MKKSTKIFLYGVIALVCVLMIVGMVSAIVGHVSGFWSSPLPIYEAMLGLWISNFDIASIGLPICGICLMLLYIDLRQQSDKRG